MIETETVTLKTFSPTSEPKATAERTSNMYATEIDLSETKRVQIIELCNACLADAVDLQLLQTRALECQRAELQRAASARA